LTYINQFCIIVGVEVVVVDVVVDVVVAVTVAVVNHL
jgi:hypothetical protein